jgi:hypothetical protein
MYCTGCGQEIDASDKFCSNCGKAISKKISIEGENKESATSPVTNIPPQPLVKTGDKSWIYVLLYIGVGIAIVGCFAAVIIPILARQKANWQSITVLTFWIGILTAIIGKQKGKSVWLWFLMGFLGIGFIVFLLIGFIRPLLVRYVF